MIDGRYVVLGLALARSPWFRSVAAWSNSASIPVEFVKCASAVEAQAHLASTRRFSALLVDGGIRALDRDLIDRARSAGCAVVVVDDVRIHRDWRGLGAAAVINPVFERQDLLDVLAEHGRELHRAAEVPGDHVPPTTRAGRGHVAMVCGAGGAGSSTVAIALAQGLATTPAYDGRVLLADLALHGDQAMLHDARDVVPGVQELVEAHRTARPRTEDLHTFTFAVDTRGYQLLLGLRRARDWPAVRPRAFAAAFDSMVRAWRGIVTDSDAELEGEHETGSVDLEERNVMARTAAARADVVLAVGLPGMKGTHSLVRVIGDLLEHDVPAPRIVPVINRAPKSPRQRAELASALATLLRGRPGDDGRCGPVFVPERKVDDCLRDGVRLPAPVVEPVVGAFLAVFGRVGPRDAVAPEPQLVEPGSLGRWATAGDGV